MNLVSSETSKKRLLIRVVVLLVLGATAIGYVYARSHYKQTFVRRWLSGYPSFAWAGPVERPPASERERFTARLVEAAMERTTHRVLYDAAYVRIPYPGGDVPADKGVCSDEIVRIYRKVGIDLQQRVHEDMAKHFDKYPRLWSQSVEPDSNIDHRRVPNLMTFFMRHGETLPITKDPKDYLPGDVVCWDLGSGVTHIGMVVGEKSPDGKRRMIVHNVGAGPMMEDVLFTWKIIAHFRYFGDERAG